MQIFGLNLSISRVRAKAALESLATWWKVFDFTGGFFQADDTGPINEEAVSRNWAVFTCISRIADDIAMMPATVMLFNRLTQIWDATQMRPVLRKPNAFQTRIDFFKMWVFSLLLNGNTYVLKQRDPATGFVVALFILDPCKVLPLVNAETGDVFYQLSPDNMSQITDMVVVPASEIMHDRLHTIWHPLIGVSPLYACAQAAIKAAAIMKNSEKFFKNMSRPSGVLTAPGTISNETATRLKTKWEENFSGNNSGRVAVLGDGLTYEQMTINAVDSQLIEQLKFSGEQICATFHVPPYKVGLGQMPTVNNLSALDQQYYAQALQPIAENMELRTTEGLDLSHPFAVWFDESVFLRMDPATRMKTHAESIGGGFVAPNEARRQENLAPVPGGESPYLQQQNYSLAALAKRDAKDDPFASAKEPATQPAAGSASPEKSVANDVDADRFDSELVWKRAA